MVCWNAGGIAIEDPSLLSLNGLIIRKSSFRASVDMPTGVMETDMRIHCGQISHCTGIVKAPVLDSLHAEFVGRLRYLNLDFFTDDRSQKKLRGFTSRCTSLRKLARL